MKGFSIEQFAAHLESLAAGMPMLEAEMLEFIGITVEQAAKDKIGVYQPEAGPFGAWAPLAESTVADKARKGYGPYEDPLLRTGELRDSIEHRVEGNQVEIGSDLDIALYQEMGTDRIPPRSFLGAAAFEQAPKLMVELGLQMENYLAGGEKK